MELFSQWTPPSPLLPFSNSLQYFCHSSSSSFYLSNPPSPRIEPSHFLSPLARKHTNTHRPSSQEGRPTAVARPTAETELEETIALQAFGALSQSMDNTQCLRDKWTDRKQQHWDGETCGRLNCLLPNSCWPSSDQHRPLKEELVKPQIYSAWRASPNVN